MSSPNSPLRFVFLFARLKRSSACCWSRTALSCTLPGDKVAQELCTLSMCFRCKQKGTSLRYNTSKNSAMVGCPSRNAKKCACNFTRSYLLFTEWVTIRSLASKSSCPFAREATNDAIVLGGVRLSKVFALSRNRFGSVQAKTSGCMQGVQNSYFPLLPSPPKTKTAGSFDPAIQTQ